MPAARVSACCWERFLKNADASRTASSSMRWVLMFDSSFLTSSPRISAPGPVSGQRPQNIRSRAGAGPGSSTTSRARAWACQSMASPRLQQAGGLGQVAADGVLPCLIGSGIGGPGRGAVDEPVDGPEAVPAQRPLRGGKTAAVGQGVLGAARGDVGVEQFLDAAGIRVLDGAGPGCQVQQAGTVERAGEVQHPQPPASADVDGGRVELRVAESERRELGSLAAGLRGVGQGGQHAVDVAGLRPVVPGRVQRPRG